jgi:hypothetical protein
MRRRKKQNAQDAARIGFHVLAMVISEQRNRRLVLAGKLNNTGGGAGMKPQPMPDDNFALDHGFLGASNSPAL